MINAMIFFIIFRFIIESFVEIRDTKLTRKVENDSKIALYCYFMSSHAAHKIFTWIFTWMYMDIYYKDQTYRPSLGIIGVQLRTPLRSIK